MKKLKLQMQISVDGFVAGPNGELDWMLWDWDKKLEKFVDDLTDSVDTILLGRKMTDGFVSHWLNVLNNTADPAYPFARKMIDTPKVVFSRTLNESKWINTELAKGDTAEYINKLKAGSGKDIIVYGGAGFVSSLIGSSLIDEYHLFINPAAIGKGLRIFKDLSGKLNLKLAESIKFDCGIVQNCYFKNL